MNLEQVLKDNLQQLKENPYPGRILIVGIDDAGGHLIQVYGIMGRSENSRNRIFEVAGERLYTVAADPSKVKDPSLIMYNAMRGDGKGNSVVSNGSQTDEVIKTLQAKGGFRDSLRHSAYEPDAPNYTPRITALCSTVGPHLLEVSVLRKSSWNTSCEQEFYSYDRVPAGTGMCVHTYEGDGDPLPSFNRKPYLMPLWGDAGNIIDTYWRALNRENIVALAVKTFDVSTQRSTITVKNRYEKVTAAA